MGKVIYISNTPDKTDLNEIVAKKLVNVAASNYNYQIMLGLIKNGHSVLSIYDFPISNNEINGKFHNLIYSNDNREPDFLYFYQASIGYKLKVLKDIIKNEKESPIIICDPLSLKNTLVILLLKQIYKFKSIAIVTDLPRFFYSDQKKSIKDFLFSHIGEISLYFFDSYVLVSNTLSEERFIRGKKYIVKEGIFEDEIDVRSIIKNVSKTKRCIYSGVISKEYGVLEMMTAFSKLDMEDIILEIYSSDSVYGEFEELLNDKIIFKGYLDRRSLRLVQANSYLLINPRPISLPFVKYSFPSKVIEYMSSGVPTLTTRLSSIPTEFNDCLFYFSGDTVNEMTGDLKRILNLNIDELVFKAKKAQELILKKYKSDLVAEEIIKLIN